MHGLSTCPLYPTHCSCSQISTKINCKTGFARIISCRKIAPIFLGLPRNKSYSRSFKVLAFDGGDEVEEDVMGRMEKCVGSVQRNFSTIRTGRATPDMLDRIEVDYYGAPTPLRQLAGISVPESTCLVIQPYDQGSLPSVEKAILNSDLGLTPNNDGKLIRLNIPQLTADRRKELAKQASKMAEDGKIAIRCKPSGMACTKTRRRSPHNCWHTRDEGPKEGCRNVRRDAMKAIGQLEKDGMGEDEKKALEDSIQEFTDDAVKQIEELFKNKQDDLTKV